MCLAHRTPGSGAQEHPSGSHDRVVLGTATAEGAVRDVLLLRVQPVLEGLKQVDASTYAKDVSVIPPTPAVPDVADAIGIPAQRSRAVRTVRCFVFASGSDRF